MKSKSFPSLPLNIANLTKEVNGTPPINTAPDADANQQENGNPPPKITGGSGRDEPRQ